MPSISEELTHLETLLTLALTELDALKAKAVRLEAENAKLIQRLSPYSEETTDTAVTTESLALQSNSDGLDALSKLYAEGYHVCHPAFGQLRDNRTTQDCIYCLKVLKGATL